MMAMYALERRNTRFILAVAGGCLLSSAYGFLAGAWPVGVVEVIWSGIAFRRWRRAEHSGREHRPPGSWRCTSVRSATR